MSYLLELYLKECENIKGDVSFESNVSLLNGVNLNIYLRRRKDNLIIGVIGKRGEKISVEEMVTKFSKLRKYEEKEKFSFFLDKSIEINILAPLGLIKPKPDSKVNIDTVIYYPLKRGSTLYYYPYGSSYSSMYTTMRLRELIPSAFVV